MKTCFTLLLLFLFYNASAKENTEIASRRAQYYAAGMTESIRYYDSILNYYVQLRTQNKLEEQVFLKQYRFFENQYAKQQYKVALDAGQWAAENKPGKLISKALELVANGKAREAAQTLNAKLINKKISKRNKADFQFLAALYSFTGDYSNGIIIYQRLIKDKNVSVNDLLTFTRLFHTIYRDSVTVLWLSQAAALSPQDTLNIVRGKIILSEIYTDFKEPNNARAVLVEAQYLLGKLATGEQQQSLLAQTLDGLARLQLDANDFDNAHVNGKASVRIYKGSGQIAAFTAASGTLAMVYKRAGANKEADSVYKKVLSNYEQLASQQPELYHPLLVKTLDEYATIDRWFDRNKEHDEKLIKSGDILKKMMELHYPFYALQYANNRDMLARKLMDIDVKIYLSEEKLNEAKDVLEPVGKQYLMIAGNELCGVLYKISGAKFALKMPEEATRYLAEDLKVRELIYQLAPSENKKELMTLLFENGVANTFYTKNKELAMEQLGAAKVLADELGDTRIAAEIQKVKLKALHQ